MALYVNDKNFVEIEGNVYNDPCLYFNKFEGKNICKLTVANNYYPNQNERECSYYNVRIYDKELIELILETESGVNYKGRRVRIIGRLRQIREGDGEEIKSRIIIVCEKLEFLDSRKK